MRADTTGSVTAKVGLKRWINVYQEEKGDGQRKWSVDRYQGGVSRSVCCLYNKTYKEGELTSGQAWVGILAKLTESVLWRAMCRGALGSGHCLAWLWCPPTLWCL